MQEEWPGLSCKLHHLHWREIERERSSQTERERERAPKPFLGGASDKGRDWAGCGCLKSWWNYAGKKGKVKNLLMMIKIVSEEIII